MSYSDPVVTTSNEYNNKNKIYHNIKTLILNHNLYTDIDLKSKKFKKKNGEKCSKQESIKILLINSSLHKETTTIKYSKRISKVKEKADFFSFFQSLLDFNGLYFLDIPESVCVEISKALGVIAHGPDWNYDNFSITEQKANIPISPKMGSFTKIKHIYSNVIVIDKYLFSKNSKINNLANALSNLRSNNSVITLLILTDRGTTSNEYFHEKLFFLENLFNSKSIVKTLKICLLAIDWNRNSLKDDNNIFSFTKGDRFYITNYLFVTTGHPHDRITHFSSSFLPLDISNELRWESAFRNLYLLYKTHPIKIGNIQFKYLKEPFEFNIFNTMNLEQKIKNNAILFYQKLHELIFMDEMKAAKLYILEEMNSSRYYNENDEIIISIPEFTDDDLNIKFPPTWVTDLMHEVIHEYQFKVKPNPSKDAIELYNCYQQADNIQRICEKTNLLGFNGNGHDKVFYQSLLDISNKLNISIEKYLKVITLTSVDVLKILDEKKQEWISN